MLLVRSRCCSLVLRTAGGIAGRKRRSRATTLVKSECEECEATISALLNRAKLVLLLAYSCSDWLVSW